MVRSPFLGLFVFVFAFSVLPGFSHATDVLTVCETVGPECNFSSIAAAVQSVSQNDTLILVATRSSGSYVEDRSNVTYNNVTLRFAGFVVVTCILPPCINLNAGLRLNLEGGPVQFDVDLESLKKRGTVGTTPNIVLAEGSQLYQDCNVTINQHYGPYPLPSGVLLGQGARWEQSGSLSIIGVTQFTGVLMEQGGVWNQRGVTLLNLSDSSIGVQLLSSGSFWNQYGEVHVVQSSESTGVRVGQEASWNQLQQVHFWDMTSSIGIDLAQNMTWQQNNSVHFESLDNATEAIACTGTRNTKMAMGWTASPSAVVTYPSNYTALCEPYVAFFVSNSTKEAGVPLLQFNSTDPDVLLAPKDGSGNVRADRAVGLTLARISELGPNSALVSTAALTTVNPWRELDGSPLNASQAFLFEAQLRVTDAEGVQIPTNPDDPPKVAIEFFLFDRERSLALGNVSFDVLPSLAKFTIKMRSWPWQSGVNKLSVKFKIRPSFDDFELVSGGNPLLPGLTSFDLLGQFKEGRQDRTRLRLLKVVELDDQFRYSGAEFKLDSLTSELVLQFPYFESHLTYDPDMGVLLGEGSKSGSSDDDNTALIVCVAVLIPLAVLFVIATIVVISVFAHKRAKRQRRTMDLKMRQLWRSEGGP